MRARNNLRVTVQEEGMSRGWGIGDGSAPRIAKGEGREMRRYCPSVVLLLQIRCVYFLHTLIFCLPSQRTWCTCRALRGGGKSEREG